jgi:hypothetical protein
MQRQCTALFSYCGCEEKGKKRRTGIYYGTSIVRGVRCCFLAAEKKGREDALKYGTGIVIEQQYFQYIGL